MCTGDRLVNDNCFTGLLTKIRAPTENDKSKMLEQSSWKNLPDLIFSDISMMVDLEGLNKCRQVCQSWNWIICQMTKLKKDTIRRSTESLAAPIREKLNRKRAYIKLPKILTGASLANLGLLGSVSYLTLVDLDLASVPTEHLASLASCVTRKVEICNVSSCDMVIILDSVKSDKLVIADQSLGSEETRALVRDMESRVEVVVLGVWNEMSLDIGALTQYNGQGRCSDVRFWDDTRDKYGEEVRSWAQRINLKAITEHNRVEKFSLLCRGKTPKCADGIRQ